MQGIHYLRRQVFKLKTDLEPETLQTSIQDLRKVLIVTYYWPPSGGSGVQRWLKFVKYLPSFGWQPFVYTPENPAFEIRDDTLLKDVPAEAEVLRMPIWEPYGLFRKTSALLGAPAPRHSDLITTGRKTVVQAITSWIRGNLFIPDARVFWVKPSVRFLSDFLVANKIQTLVTTGPPHSLHLIGLKLKKLQPSLRWIVDMRDPWSEWDLLDTLSLTGLARRRHQRLEREVLQRADRVVTIAPYHVNRMEKLSGRKVELITNGFDEDDFAGIRHIRTKKFTIRHIGMVDELRDPRPFMEALKQWLSEEPAFCDKILVEFIGSVNSSFRKYISEEPTLGAITRFRDPMPHGELVQLYGETDIQLLVLAHTALAPGNLPGKFFEYLASGNFILGMGPATGDAAAILEQTGAGKMVERTDAAGLKEQVRTQLRKWERGERPTGRDVSAYSRKNLTARLTKWLDSKRLTE